MGSCGGHCGYGWYRVVQFREVSWLLSLSGDLFSARVAQAFFSVSGASSRVPPQVVLSATDSPTGLATTHTLHEPPRAYLQLLGTAHSTIAESCLGYLNFQQVRARPSLSQSPTPNLPFLHLQHAPPQLPTHCFSNILLSLGGPRAKRSIRRARN